MNIYWDYLNAILAKDLSGSNQISDLTWVLRDQVPIVLYLVEPATSGGDYYQVVENPSGCAPVFGAKASSGLAGAHLIYNAAFVKTGTGATTKHTATLNLNTAELIAAVPAAATVELIGEFVLVDASGNHRDSCQFTLYVKPDVTRGTEASPLSVYAPCLVQELVVGGVKYLILQNSDGVEYARIAPP